MTVTRFRKVVIHYADVLVECSVQLCNVCGVDERLKSVDVVDGRM